MNSEVLDVDMLAFERGSSNAKQTVVDGVMKSLETGFVYTSHDMSKIWTKFTACLANSSKSTPQKETAKQKVLMDNVATPRTFSRNSLYRCP